MQLGEHLPDDTAVPLVNVVADLFADVFERSSVTLDDDFFELGGDSLAGTSLMAAVEKRFGLVLPFSVLLEAPTPRALAAMIFAKNVKRVGSLLIGINPNGTAPPIFCIHGNTGESVLPPRLSAMMPERAFFAFRAMGLEQGENLLITVDAFANRYVASMRRARWHEKPVLLGHCAGATIAYEMAQRLIRQGKPPAGLILVDPEVSSDFAPYLHNSGLGLALMQSAWNKRAAQLKRAIDANPNPSGDMRRKLVAGGVKHAVGTYAPKAYPGPALLICSEERKGALLNKERGYPSLIADLEVVELPHEHGDLFHDGLQDAVRAIERFVDRL